MAERSRKLVPWGYYAVPHLKKHKRDAGKNAASAKPGVFVGYADHKGFSACQILDTKTRCISVVPYEQVTFHRDCFPYLNPSGQDWPQLEITEIPDELTSIEGSEVMCSPELEPYVMGNVRTRARVAAAETAARADRDKAQVEEERAAIQAVDAARSAPVVDSAQQIAREREALDQLADCQAGCVFLDEEEPVKKVNTGKQLLALVDNKYILFCGHAKTGDKNAKDILPDPLTWDEATNSPDWKDWIEVSRAERRNLKKHCVYRVLSKDKVLDLLRQGVRIHTCRNVLKKKIDEHCKPYQHKSRASFQGFTEIERFDFHETFAAVASSTVVHLVISLAVGLKLRLHQLNVVGAYLYAPLAADLYMWAPDGIRKFKDECWQLLSHLYCEKAAGAAWKKLFRDLLIEFGFKAVNLDETLFVMHNEKKAGQLIIVEPVPGPSSRCP
eukprot:539258-Rhodomonas_salina.1